MSLILIVILASTSALISNSVLGVYSSGAIATSALFNIITAWIYIAVWKMVALTSKKSLPTFFLSASGIRLVLAATTVLVFCFVNRGDNMTIKTFAVVFIAFYMLMVAFDTWFFVMTEKLKKN